MPSLSHVLPPTPHPLPEVSASPHPLTFCLQHLQYRMAVRRLAGHAHQRQDGPEALEGGRGWIQLDSVGFGSGNYLA